MADLIEQVGLDISGALGDADTLGQAAGEALDAGLSSAVDAFSSNFIDAISGLGDLLATELGTLPVNADVTPAETEVASLVATVDGETAAIAVDADTTDAVDSVDDLTSSIDGTGASAEAASGHVSGLGLSTGQLAGVAGLAVGEVGGLREASSLLGERTAVATTGALGLAAGIGELYHQGLNALSAEQRFTQALGDQAEAVQKVKVGDLDTDLFELTQRMGATDAATRNAAATVFQFGVNAGATRSDAAQFTDTLFALASRAVALNPALGDVTDVATRMEVGLGRARSAAQQFGISVSQAEINTRALDDTGKSSASDLTAYEKSVAGAEIAVERYGGTLNATITVGSHNAAIEQRALKSEFEDFLASAGKPLVAPALDAIKASIPVAEDLGKALGDVAKVAIPVVTAALNVLGPAIEPVLVGFLAIKALTLGSALVSEVLGLAAGMGLLGAEAASDAAEFGVATAAMSVDVESLGAVIDAAIPILGTFAAGFAIGTVIAQPVHDFLFGTATDFDALAKSADAATKAVVNAAEGQLLPAFEKLAAAETKRVDATDLANKSDAARLGNLTAFRAVAEASLPTAVKIAEQTDKGSQAYKDQQAVLVSVAAAQKQTSVTAQEGADSFLAVTQKVDLAGGAYDAARAQFGDFVTTIAAGAGVTAQNLDDLATHLGDLDKSTSSAFDSATSVVTKFASATSVSSDQIIGFLGDQVKAATTWSTDLQTLAKAGIDQGLIEQLRQAGPTAEPLIQGLLQTVTSGGLGAVNDAEASLRTILGATNSTLDSMEVDAQVHFAEIDQVAQAKTADLAAGGTKNLDALRTSSNQALADMATQAEQDMGRVGAAVVQLPDGKVITITADFQPVYDAIQAARPVLQALSDSGSADATFLLSAAPPPRALGGPVTAGLPYLVNENTPNSEIFVPSVSGVIYPAGQAPKVYTPTALTVPGPALQGGPASVSHQDDHSIVVNVDARGATDPANVGFTTARELRSEQYLYA